VGGGYVVIGLPIGLVMRIAELLHDIAVGSPNVRGVAKKLSLELLEELERQRRLGRSPSEG